MTPEDKRKLELWEVEFDRKCQQIKRVRKLYFHQKSAAKARGIPFLISIKDWENWWEGQLGPDWFSKRGSERGKYVMARLDDKGPYQLGNIKCILTEDNIREVDYSGSKNGRAKLTEVEALSILNASGTQRKIAAQYNISQAVVGHIKTGVLWSHVTKLPSRKRNTRFIGWR